MRDVNQLYTIIYTHCLGTIKKYVKKAKRLKIEEALQVAVARLDSKDAIATIVPEWTPEMVKRARTLLEGYQLALRVYNQFDKVSKDDQAISSKISVLYRRFNAMDKVIATVRKEGFDIGHMMAICESCLKEKNLILRKPDAFERFWDKALNLERSSIQQLLFLTRSYSMGKFLDKKITVMDIEPREEVLRYHHPSDPYMRRFFAVSQPGNSKDAEVFSDSDPDSDVGNVMAVRREDDPMDAPVKEHAVLNIQPRPGTMEEFVNSLRKGNSTEKFNEPLAVHAECLMLLHLVENGISAFPYIATSKLCCVGCWLFFRGFNELMRVKLDPRRYFVRGTHSRAFLWVIPWAQKGTDDDIALAIEKQMRRAALQYFETTVLARNLSLSCAGSDVGVSVAEEEGVEGLEGWLDVMREQIEEEEVVFGTTV